MKIILLPMLMGLCVARSFSRSKFYYVDITDLYVKDNVVDFECMFPNNFQLYASDFRAPDCSLPPDARLVAECSNQTTTLSVHVDVPERKVRYFLGMDSGSENCHAFRVSNRDEFLQETTEVVRNEVASASCHIIFTLICIVFYFAF